MSLISSGPVRLDTQLFTTTCFPADWLFPQVVERTGDSTFKADTRSDSSPATVIFQHCQQVSVSGTFTTIVKSPQPREKRLSLRRQKLSAKASF